ncbi:MAG: acetyl-CoA C-acetyltransferase [Deltaproteobacteria bacterium]|nr:acetyl-CoA C-acetyltransferase [Deltaproteobacteria bacterium]
MADVFIFDALRTPRGRGKAGKGGLANHHPQELLAQTLNHMAERSKLDKNLVEDLAVGCVTQVKEQGACIARVALIAAQWPEDVTGFTINRFCGSGLEGVNSIAAKIGAGFIDGGIGGGVESMSRVPMGSDGAMLDGLNEKLRKRLYLVPQGISADLIATREGFTRADVDKFALASQQKAARAIEEKRFANSLFAVKNDDGSVALDRDEHPRADTTIEGLGGLQAAFAQMGGTAMGPNGETLDQLALLRYPDTKQIDHVHTGGNSSGIVDGAAVVLMGSAEWGKKAGLKPRARIRAASTAGAEPVIMLTAPAPASQKALKRAGMQVKDIDLWEINEAFATVPMQTARALGIDHDKINVNGGAIALGHPLGATGAILLGTALDELERANKATALITLCIGGGMGIATIIERV